MSRPTAHSQRVVMTLMEMQVLMWDLGISLRSKARKAVELAFRQLEASLLADQADWNRRAWQSFSNTGEINAQLVRERQDLHKREVALEQTRKELRMDQYARHDDLTVAAA